MSGIGNYKTLSTSMVVFSVQGTEFSTNSIMRNPL